MKPEELDKLAELLEAATPGPWQEMPNGRLPGAIVTATLRQVAMVSGDVAFEDARTTTEKVLAANAALIVALVNAAPALLAMAWELLRLEAELHILKGVDADALAAVTAERDAARAEAKALLNEFARQNEKRANAEMDRDEWRIQHENLLHMYRTAEDGRVAAHALAEDRARELDEAVSVIKTMYAKSANRQQLSTNDLDVAEAFLVRVAATQKGKGE